MSMAKLIKNGCFSTFWSIRAEKDQKWTQKMGQKMSDIFFQYQDFTKSRYPGFFSKHVFCPSPNWLIFHILSFFSSTGIFQKIFVPENPGTGKSEKPVFSPRL